MAETKQSQAKQPQETGKGVDYASLSPNTITDKDYQTLKAEKEELIKKKDMADNEFMFRHYTRQLATMDKTMERAGKANLVFERKERRAHDKGVREGFKQARKRAKEG